MSFILGYNLKTGQSLLDDNNRKILIVYIIIYYIIYIIIYVIYNITRIYSSITYVCIPGA